MAEGVCVFDPNGGNAFLMSGDSEAANGASGSRTGAKSA